MSVITRYPKLLPPTACRCRQACDPHTFPGKYLWLVSPSATGAFTRFVEPFRMEWSEADLPVPCVWRGQLDDARGLWRAAVSWELTDGLGYPLTQHSGVTAEWLVGFGETDTFNWNGDVVYAGSFPCGEVESHLGDATYPPQPSFPEGSDLLGVIQLGWGTSTQHPF